MAAGVAAWLAGSAGCAPELDWRQANAEGGASALLPCRPAVQTRALTLAAVPVQMTLMACSAGGTAWALAAADVKDPGRVGTALTELRASAAANVDARTVRALPWQVPGATPQAASGRDEIEGRLRDGRAVRMHVAVFSRGTFVYQATVLATDPEPSVVSTFFEGLRAGS